MLTVGFRGLRHLATNMFEEVQIIARCRFRWRVGPSVMMVMKPDEDAQHDGHGDQLGGRLSCLAHPTQKPRGRLKRPTAPGRFAGEASPCGGQPRLPIATLARPDGRATGSIELEENIKSNMQCGKHVNDVASDFAT